MDKHTKGPWTVRKVGTAETANPCVSHWIDGPDGVPIADVKMHGLDVLEGDAALIAAAPAMYEALAEIEAIAADYEDGAPDAGAQAKAWGRVAQAARKAREA